MTNTIEIVNAPVTLIIKAAILASSFSGRARNRNQIMPPPYHI